ncbi:MAG TPA: hypothetical protein PLR25_26660, partial [Planctomycetaceae bacterium]|nr:hypothetical protein [Planctomycetaceae bacterium]
GRLAPFRYNVRLFVHRCLHAWIASKIPAFGKSNTELVKSSTTSMATKSGEAIPGCLIASKRHASRYSAPFVSGDHGIESKSSLGCATNSSLSKWFLGNI